MSVPQFEKSGEGIEKIKLSVRVGSDMVPFTIEQPDRRRFGGDISDQAVLYLTGWTESEDSLKPLRTATARLGMAAVTMYHPRYVRPDKVFRAPHLRVKNVATVSRLLQDEYEGVSLAGHSFGGIDGTRAAYEESLNLRVLALLGSAGLIAQDDFGQVAPRVLEEIVKAEGGQVLQHPVHEGRFVLESIKTILRSPALAASEGLAAASHYVGSHVRPLVESGVVVANIMADGDKIFPLGAVQDSTTGLPFDEEHVIHNANHNFTYNRAVDVAALVSSIISRADSIRAARQDPLAITVADIERDLFGTTIN